jgi:hypothetical protein
MVSKRMVHPGEKTSGVKNVYLGIQILPSVMEEDGDFSLTSVTVPQDLSVTLHTERVLQVRYITTSYSLNGTPLVYTLTVTKDGEIGLSILGKDIHPLSLGFPNKIRMTNSDLQAVFKIVRVIVLCTGVSLDGWKEVSIPQKFSMWHFVEQWTKSAKGCSVGIGWYIRSKNCSVAQPMSTVNENKTCIQCKNLKTDYVNRGRLVPNANVESIEEVESE